MTAWTALEVFRQVLITYYFGSPVAFYSGVVTLFVLALIMAGLDFRMAMVFSLPLVGAFTVYGVFGAYTWVGNGFLLICAFIYGYALIDLFT